jgi:Flp pilus assembly protein TadG
MEFPLTQQYRFRRYDMKKQTGAAMVEFALTALVFFTVMFGLIESARLFFTVNTLTEMSRRGARLATVCYPTAPQITQATLFNNPTDIATSSNILPMITTNNVRVRYLDKNGCYINALNSSVDPNTLASTTFDQIRYVSVQIINYTHSFIFPPFTIPLGSTAGNHCVTESVRVFAETVLPREALGVRCRDAVCTPPPITNDCPSP